MHCKSSNVNRVRLMNLIRWEGRSYSGFVLYLKILVVVKNIYKWLFFFQILSKLLDIFACSILQTAHLGKGYLSSEFLFCLQKFSIFACQKKSFPELKIESCVSYCDLNCTLVITAFYFILPCHQFCLMQKKKPQNHQTCQIIITSSSWLCSCVLDWI